MSTTIQTRYKGDMLFESQLGNHSIVIDVPAKMGGSDRGPTPPELFIASLGSCIAAFVADYCKRAEIDATGLSVDITFDKVENPMRLVGLKAHISLPHADCASREAALLRVAEHCPVHETIKSWEGMEITLAVKQ